MSNVYERFIRQPETIATLEGRIAALEQRIVALEAERPSKVMYDAPNNTQEECESHRCSYFTHYLAYGGPDLTHEGFHAAEREGFRHVQACNERNDQMFRTGNYDAYRPCGLCAKWEERLRA